MVAVLEDLKGRHFTRVADWSGRGAMMRLHVGLEDPDDLIADLRQAFAALAP